MRDARPWPAAEQIDEWRREQHRVFGAAVLASHSADKHVDEAKGRVKEAAGSLSGDQSLKNEGKADQAKATVKDKVDKVVDTLTGRGRE